ncbi:MAG: S8/S53 family peptidase [Candidatus Thiodiazotropha sp.]
MEINSIIPVVFIGFELEFSQYPTKAKILEVIKYLNDRISGRWNIQRIFDDEYMYEVVGDIGMQVAPGMAFNITRELKNIQEIEYANPIFDYEDVSAFNEDDTELDTKSESSISDNYEWHLDQVRAKKAWEIPPVPPTGRVKGAGVIIAHLDTGYTDHYELVEDGDVDVSKGYNFYENVASPIEPLNTMKMGHGTATGSVLISRPGRSPTNPNLSYVSGVAPEAKLVPIRVDKNVWFLSARKDIRGIKHAINIGAHVISMSRGGLSSRSFKKAIEKANKRGIIVIAAAGNCNLGCKVRAPAEFTNVVCVGGTTINDKPWKKTSRGPEVNVCAPANRVWRARTQNKNNTYFYDVGKSSGTSYATPIVAGAAALWIAFNGGHEALSQKLGGVERIPEAFMNQLAINGTWIPKDGWNQNKYGEGILDTDKLLRSNLPIKEFNEHSEVVKNSELIAFFGAILEPQTSHTEKLMEEIYDELMFNLRTNFELIKLYQEFIDKAIDEKELTVRAKQSLILGDISDLMKTIPGLVSE